MRVEVSERVEALDPVVDPDQHRVVAHPVGHDLHDPGVAQHPVVVRARRPDRLGEGVVPVHAHGGVPRAVLVPRVEATHPLAVLPVQPVRKDLVAAVAHQPGDDVTDDQRAAVPGSEVVTHRDVLHVPWFGAPNRLGRIVLVDRSQLVVAVHVLLAGVLERVALGRGVALGVHEIGVPDRDQRAVIVPVHATSHGQRRAAAEARVRLLFDTDVEAANPDAVAVTHRLEEADVVAGPEHVDAGQRASSPPLVIRGAPSSFGVMPAPSRKPGGATTAPQRDRLACSGSHHSGLSSPKPYA